MRWVALRAILIGILGLLCTLALAWAAAVLRPTDGWPNVLGQSRGQWGERYRLPQFRYSEQRGDVLVDYVGTRVSSEIAVFPEWSNPPEAKVPELANIYRFPDRIDPRVTELFPGVHNFSLPGWAPKCGPDAREHMIRTSAWGWPWRALAGTERTFLTVAPNKSFVPQFRLENYWSLKGHPSVTRIRRLPLMPFWPGLLADSALFSLAWVPLILFPGFILRLLRRRRGRCPRCGYDLAHDFASGCPECGWGRSAPASATASATGGMQRSMK